MELVDVWKKGAEVWCDNEDSDSHIKSKLICYPYHQVLFLKNIHFLLFFSCLHFLSIYFQILSIHFLYFLKAHKKLDKRGPDMFCEAKNFFIDFSKVRTLCTNSKYLCLCLYLYIRCLYICIHIRWRIYSFIFIKR